MALRRQKEFATTCESLYSSHRDITAKGVSFAARQIQLSFHLLAVRHRELPVLGVMIGVDEGERNSLHVSVLRAQEIGRLNKIEND